MKIKTANTSYIGLPVCPTSFFNTSTVNIRIDWGDSSVETFSSLNDANITQVEDDSGNVIANIFRHSYLSGDNYTINVSGGFGSAGEEKLAFCQQSNHSNGIAQDVSGSLEKASFDKITGIEELSNFYIHGQGDFKGFTNLVEIPNGASHLLSDSPASSIVLSTNSSATMLMDKTFENCTSLKKLNFKPQNMTSCQYTFKNSCYSPTPAWELQNWDMSNVASTRGMFEGSSFNGYIGQWDLSSVEDCSSMFKNNKVYNRWVKSFFDSSNALKNASSMFEGAEEFNQRVDWNVPSLENASAMFKNTKKFNKFVNSLFKKDGTSYAIEDTSSIFEGAEKFNKPLNWDMKTVKNASAMFKNTKAFNQSLRNFFKYDNTSPSITGASSMFEGAEEFNSPLWGWDFSTVKDASAMFKSTQKFNHRSSKFIFNANENKTYSITGVSGIFEGAQVFNQDICKWDTTTIKDASAMFKNTKAFNARIDDLFKKASGVTYNLENVNSMFEGAEAFNKPIFNWDSENIKVASAMFKSTKVFNSSIKNLFGDTSLTYALTDVSSMFESAEKFNQPLSWSLTGVKNASAMFKNTKEFNKFVNSLFKKDGTSYAIEDTSSIFEGAEKFNKPLNWDMKTVKNASAMFKNTKAFNNNIQKLFDGDSIQLTDASSMFEGTEVFNSKIIDWNMVSVQNVSAMFKNAKAYNKHLAKWFKKDSSKTYAVTNMESMFEGSIFNKNLTGSDFDPDSGWDTSSVENVRSMFKNMPITLDHSVDRILQRAVSSGSLKKSRNFVYGTNMRKGWNDTHSSKFSATASLSSNVLTINATLVGNYDYWSYKVVNTNTQSFASVSEVLVQNGDTSVDITLDPGSYEIYAKGYIS